jgi:RNA 3'-terminal phosphate cyclase
MDQQTYLITFEGVPPAVANRYSDELKSVLLKASSEIEVQQRREDVHAQDFGATLVLVLGAPAVVAAVKALGDWLQRRHGVGLTMKTENGEVIATNLTSKDALKLAELLRSPKQ